MSKEYVNSFSPSSLLRARLNPLIFLHFLSDGCPKHTYFKLESFNKLILVCYQCQLYAMTSVLEQCKESTPGGLDCYHSWTIVLAKCLRALRGR
jgi:hypothetical protein